MYVGQDGTQVFDPDGILVVHPYNRRVYRVRTSASMIQEYLEAGWEVAKEEEDRLKGNDSRNLVYGFKQERVTDKLGNTVEVNESGAMQAIVDGRYDLLDYNATRVLAEVYAYGANKYAEENWRGIDARSHLNHALRHILMALHEMRTGVNPEPGEDHMAHAVCRTHMALAIREQGGPSKEAMK